MNIANLSQLQTALPHGLPLGTTPEYSDDIASIKAQALEYIEDLLEEFLPGGTCKGNEYCVLNPNREDQREGSFKVNMAKGVWSDFATGEGGDLVDLVVYVRRGRDENFGFKEAIRELKELVARCSGEGEVKDGTSKRRVTVHKRIAEATEWEVVVPVPDDAPPAERAISLVGPSAEAWRYDDASGNAVGFVVRTENLLGKFIAPLTYCRHESGRCEWRKKGIPAPRPLYNLPELVSNPERPIIFVEGEKCAEAAKRLFLAWTATTTYGGANAADKTDFSVFASLKGAIYIWADNDEPGRKYALAIAAKVHEQNAALPVFTMQLLTQEPVSENGHAELRDGFEAPAGYDCADAVDDGWTPVHIALLGEGIWSPVTFAGDAPEEVPPVRETQYGDYRVSEAGVSLVKIDKDGDASILKLASYVEPKALTRDAESKNWGIKLDYTDPDGRKGNWSMPREMLAGGEEYRSHLLSLGVRLNTDRDAKEHFAGYLMQATPTARALCVPQPGWQRGVFVLPDQAYGDFGNEEVVLQCRNPGITRLFSQQDSLQGWQQAVADKAFGNSRVVVSIATALAGPTLELLGAENGGLHFRGNSSIGKTICLAVASSVWGGPAFMQRWRATSNGLESVAQMYNGTCLPLDEMGQVEPGQAGEIAYMLGNGAGKLRSTKNGGPGPVARWQFFFISTGEVSLATHMESNHGRVMAGQEIRLIDIAADAGAGMGLFENIHGRSSPREFADELRAATQTHFGTAGRAWVEKLADRQQQPRLIARIRELESGFVAARRPADASSQVSRVLARFGLIAAVGDVCIEEGILPWTTGHASWACGECFDAWVLGRGGVRNQESDQIIGQIRGFIEQHGDTRFTPWDNSISCHLITNSERPTINRVGFKKKVDDDRYEYYVLPEAFCKVLCAGHDPKEVARLLVDRGFLIPGTDGKPYSTHRLPGFGQAKKAYRLSADLMTST